MPAEATREWIMYKQAEELSGLSRTTLWNLIRAGEVEAARVGRAGRINRESLNTYLPEALSCGLYRPPERGIAPV